MESLSTLEHQTGAEPASLVQAFEERADAVPTAAAVQFDSEEFSFREVHERANQLARHLVACGVGPEKIVAVMLPRSADLLITLLAVLKAGGAYLPLDHEHPAERTRYTLEDAKPVVLVTSEEITEHYDDLGMRKIVLDAPDVTAELSYYPAGHLSDAERTSAPAPENLAYVIYTSGSTGKPKGVEIPLRAMHNLVLAMQEQLSLGTGDRMLAVTTVTFDIAVAEIFVPLLTGACAVVASKGVAQDPRELGELIRRSGVSTAQATPTHWHMVATVSPDVLRGLRILVGGEAFSARLAETLLDLGAEVIQFYGPTETTVWSTVHPVTRADHASVIGTALRNTGLHVLDANLDPTPVGAEGELFISGAGVARGYHNQPVLTEERFLPNLFGSPDTKMYKTGDIVRPRADGTLEYVGRSDNQVKINGFRVELGEVEAAIEGCADVSQAAAMVRQDREDERSLVAYVTATPGANPSASGIRGFVAEKLPIYMVPSTVVVLAEFPLTPNGKLDRKALPAPEIGHADLVHHRLTETELLLSRLYAEVLGISQVGPNESFFDLGGSSIVAAKLIKQVHDTMGLNLPIRMLVEHPTVSDLSRQLMTDEEPQDSFDVLLPLVVKGNRRPLFCMRHLAGTAWGYGVLTQHLGPEYPIYGLQTHTFQELDTPLTTLAEIAADYVDRIRTVQPEGPYRILGWSLGGVIAHEVAVEFQRQGDEIEFLGVLNTDPIISAKEHRDEQGVMALILMIHGKDPAAYGTPLRYSDIADVADMATNYSWRGKKTAAETFVETMVNDLNAWQKHTPGRFRGTMHLATAESTAVADTATTEAWAPYVDGEIIHYNLHCTHGEVLAAPHAVKKIAQILLDNFDD